jgi:lysyl-tRNA synthetase class 2
MGDRTPVRAATEAVSDWRPSAAPARLRARADMLTAIRRFFDARGVLEVETPLMSRSGATDPALVSLEVVAEPHSAQGASGQGRYFLHTSPEFPMKRLVAAGVGPIYQICKVFRAGERGRLHHPEFTLLEWYRPGWEAERLMDEVAELVRLLLQRPEMGVERVRYRNLFREILNVDPWTADRAGLRSAAVQVGLPDAERLELDRDGWLDLLLTQCIEPRLGQAVMTFLCDYPPSQAALARVRVRSEGTSETYEVADRFELYVEAIELANGFHELTDPVEQDARFTSDLRERQHRNLPPIPPDQRLLAALASGLPESSGVALGLDRLLMVATGASHIDQVLAFPIERA